MITLKDAGRWMLGLFQPRRTLADELLAVAIGFLGLREERHNAGPVIDRWLAEVGATSPNNWCAASVAHWLRTACKNLGVPMPIVGSGGAKATMAQFVAAKRWVPIADARKRPDQLRPGMVPVWHRGAAGAWTGHIGVLEAVIGPGLFTSIEGNSGDGTEVARMVRHLSDPLLLGFGVV